MYVSKLLSYIQVEYAVEVELQLQVEVDDHIQSPCEIDEVGIEAERMWGNNKLGTYFLSELSHTTYCSQVYLFCHFSFVFNVIQELYTSVFECRNSRPDQNDGSLVIGVTRLRKMLRKINTGKNMHGENGICIIGMNIRFQKVV